jgi:hypothetical protein
MQQSLAVGIGFIKVRTQPARAAAELAASDYDEVKTEPFQYVVNQKNFVRHHDQTAAGEDHNVLVLRTIRYMAYPALFFGFNLHAGYDVR